jgi:hypothetical protein
LTEPEDLRRKNIELNFDAPIPYAGSGPEYWVNFAPNEEPPVRFSFDDFPKLRQELCPLCNCVGYHAINCPAARVGYTIPEGKNSAVDDYPGLKKVAVERARQELLGYDREHDLAHDRYHLIKLARDYLNQEVLHEDEIVKAAALLVAILDRAAAFEKDVSDDKD